MGDLVNSLSRSQVVCHYSGQSMFDSSHRGGEESWAYYVIDCLRRRGGEEQQKGRKRHRGGTVQDNHSAIYIPLQF